MGGKPGGIDINWREVFGCSSSPGREDVLFASPASPAPASGAAAKGPRAAGATAARASSVGEKRPRAPRSDGMFGTLRTQLERRAEERSPGALVGDGARRPVTRAAAKATGGRGLDAPSSTNKSIFDYDENDEGVEDASRKYCSKPSPVSSRKRNYGELPLDKPKSRVHGGQRTIPVDKMYSSQSTPFSGNQHQRKAHAIDPEDSDDGKCQQSENSSFSRFTKRRKEKLQDLSSVYSRKAQDVVLLDDDDDDMQTEEEVNYEMSDRRNEPKIYYPSRDDPEAVELTSTDINCLDPGAFLSSPVINYYIQNIKRNRLNNEDCRDKFYIFNTYFYGKLEEALYRLGDFSKLRRWWKGVNIFHRAYIILPIHGKSHWSLVIICMPAKESISGPIILHLDSLGMHRSAKILSTVERYLEEEWQHLKNNHSPDKSALGACEDPPRNIRKEKVQVPQQNNAYDCGIFMLYYIERFIKEAPKRFTIDKLDMFNCNWFKPEEASDLRQRIRELLLEEFESAKLDNAMSDAAASDGSDIEDSIKGGELKTNAPSDNSQMVVEFGNTGRTNEGIKVAASEEECGESGHAGKSNEGIKVAESEESRGESGDAGKSIEGTNVAESEEASGESGDTGKIMEGYVSESEEASGESGGTGKIMEGYVSESEEESGDADNSMEGINVAEPEEPSVESGDASKSIEVINVAESDEASVEFGHAGETKKGIKAAASEEASVKSASTDKSMEGISEVAVSDEAPSSSSKRGEKTAGCVQSEAPPLSDSIKGEEDTGQTEKEELMAIVSQESPKNKGANPSTPIPDIVCDSCDSDTETKVEVVRIYKRIHSPVKGYFILE